MFLKVRLSLVSTLATGIPIGLKRPVSRAASIPNTACVLRDDMQRTTCLHFVLCKSFACQETICRA